MADKLYDYQGPVGRFHTIRDDIKLKFANWRENNRDLDRKMVDKLLHRDTQAASDDSLKNFDFSFKFRRKTRWELIRLCAIVMGIEFSYSAITGFSSPILLEMGVSKKFMSMTFSLSALLGFFLSPLCGSLSDRCTLSFGRRRIFIIVFALLELLGLYLIPHMHGVYLEYRKEQKFINATMSESPANQTGQLESSQEVGSLNGSLPSTYEISDRRDAPLGIVMLAVLGIVIADHFADNLQNPSRAYLLDVCSEEDHTRGLSTFTILAGCGGTIGYGFGSVNWNELFIGQFLGGQIKTVFLLTGCLFFLCVLLTITTFKEIPLKLLPKIQQQKHIIYCRKLKSIDEDDDDEDGQGTAIRLQKLPDFDAADDVTSDKDNDYVSSDRVEKKKSLTNGNNEMNLLEEEAPSLREYLESIVKLPYSLQILLFTNVLCWMSHVSYSLYFTDYVGEAIFLGNPVALENSVSRSNYEEGVRFACRGMAIYSLSCMICSIFMERAIQKFGLRRVYLVNIAIDTASMFFMYFFNSKVASVAFSFASGILYCTIFTIPYIIVARYHTLNVFEVSSNGDYIHSTQVRGIGTDVAIIGSSVFIAQFFLSLGMGFIIHWYGSTEAVPLMCMLLSFFALIGAFNVVYLDM